MYEVHFAEYPGHWILTDPPLSSREEALQWARENRERLGKTRENHNFGHYCRDFFSPQGPWVRMMTMKGHHYSGKYLGLRQGQLDRYVIPQFGGRDPWGIKRREIDLWLMGLKKNDGEDLAGMTKNRIIYSLSLVFEDLRDMELVKVNPMSGIKPYNKAPVNPRGVIDRESMDRLFPPGLKELLEVWGGPLWTSLMLLFNDTGCRPGELRALTWGDLDLPKRFVPIRKGVESGTRDKIKGTKTGIVKAGFLSLRTVEALKLWQSESPSPGKDQFIFTIDGSRPVSPLNVIRAFKRGLRRTGITGKPWTPYWLRHSFGTYQMETLNQDEIMRLMGHNVAATTRVYQHPDDETLYRSTERIQEKLDKVRESAPGYPH
jgi:integrase